MYRLLTVHVKSAQIIRTVGKGLFYVKLWINSDTKLKTRLVYHNDLVRATWDQGFVFAVPQDALLDGELSIKFEIFRKNSFLKDSLVGKIEAKLDKFEANINNEIEQVKYDTSNEDWDSEDEKREMNERWEFLAEMKKKVMGEMKKGKLKFELMVSKGALNKVGKGGEWDGFAMELEEFLGDNQHCAKSYHKNKMKFLVCFRQ